LFHKTREGGGKIRNQEGKEFLGSPSDPPMAETEMVAEHHSQKMAGFDDISCYSQCMHEICCHVRIIAHNNIMLCMKIRIIFGFGGPAIVQ